MKVMKGYKQTEVGVIPEDWEVKPLCELISILHGFGFKGECFKDSGTYRLTTPGHFHESGGFRDVGERQKFYDGIVPDGYLLNKDDMIIAMTEQADGLLGSAAFIPVEGVYLHNQRLGKLKVNWSGVCDQFLYRVFNSTYYRSKVRETAAGTKVKHTSPSKLLAIPIPLPSTLAEQEAIASALSDADAWIESLEQLIAKKRQIKQGAMQELLTGKRRLPGFSGEWEECNVGEVIEKAFCGPSPTCDERNIHGDEWGVLKTTAITWEHGWDWTKHKCLPRHYWNQPEMEVHVGDVIVTKAGPRHRVGVAAFVSYVPDRILVSGKMIGLRPNTNRALGFMLAAAISATASQKFIDQRTTGMAESQVNFENGVLIATPIVLPSLPEQRAIGSVLSDMDTEIESLESKLVKARDIKQGMMQDLLTGRIRLI
jgi:type I restriction enzyme S subunit